MNWALICFVRLNLKRWRSALNAATFVALISAPVLAPETAWAQSSLPASKSRQIEAANAEVVALFQKGSLRDAIDLGHRTYEDAVEKLGEQHTVTITSLNNLAVLYKATGRYAEAEPFYSRALALRRQVLGERHPHTFHSLSNLALLYKDTGRYAEAEPLLAQALGFSREVLGELHPDTLDSMNNLAGLYQDTGRYAEAEPLFVQALALRSKYLGERHPDTINSLHNLALLYKQTGRYAQAEPLLVQALALNSEVLGERHPRTIISINALAGLYQDSGRYAEAELRYAEVLALRGEVLGERHPRTISSLSGLALIYTNTGRYAEAEPLFVKALALHREVLGERHPRTIVSLINLAFFYNVTSRYSDAEPLFVQALALSREVQGERHPHTLTGLSSLAVLYWNIGRYAEAEPLLVEALALRRKALGERHPDTISSLNNLAQLYKDTGRYADAEPLFVQALALHREVLGERHPRTIVSQNNLAGLYLDTGRYSKAELLFFQALALRREVLGERHPDTANSLNILAELFVRTGRASDAAVRLRESVDAATLWAGGEVDHAAGARAQAEALKRAKSSGNLALALAAHAVGSETAELALHVALLRKGALAERQAALLRLARQKENADLARLASEYLLARKDYATMFELAARDDDANQTAFAAATKRLDALERDLAVRSAEFRALQQGVPTVDALQAALAPNEALVEQVIFQPYNFSPDSAGSGPNHVAAVVLRKKGTPVFVDLGPLAPMLSMIDELTVSMGTGHNGEVAAAELDKALFVPLSNALEGITAIHLAPAGRLGLVPYDVLGTEWDRLADRFSVRLVTSGRALVRQLEATASAELIAFADIDYDAVPRPDPQPRLVEPVSGVLALVEAGVTPPVLRSDETRHFVPLSAMELETLAELWPARTGQSVQIYRGRDATEGALAQIAAPHVLHLSTHGFVRKVEADKSRGRTALVTGLALAGANRVEVEGETQGLMRGYEIEALDLRGTALVVISACETAIGPDDESEGIFSLARAFGISGAAAVLATLQPVEDSITAEFMLDFYDALLTTDGKLRDPQLALDEVKRTWAARDDSNYSDPRSWAPFILIWNKK